MPKVYIIFDPSPNAFATGRNEFCASVCVTAGLLALLNREETQGVLLGPQRPQRGRLGSSYRRFSG